MGRTARTRARDRALTVEHPQTAPAALELEETGDHELDAIARVRAALGAGDGAPVFLVRVHAVSKTLAGTMKEAWLFDCGPDDLEDLRPRLQRVNGPGHYRCRVLKDGKFFDNFDLFIGGAAPAPAPAIAPATNSAPVTGELAQILANQNRMLEAVLNRPAPAPFPFSLETVTGLITAGGVLIKTIKELFPAPAVAPRAQPIQVLEILEKGIELARSVDGGGQSDGLLGVLERVLSSEPIAKAIGQLAAPIAGDPAQLQQLDRGAIVPPPAPLSASLAAPPAKAPGGSQAGEASGAASEQKMVADAIAYLIGQAASGAQPEHSVQWVSENLPEGMLQHLDTVEDPVGFLAAYFPDIAKHRPWFTRLLDCLYGSDESGALPPPAPGGGHAGIKPN